MNTSGIFQTASDEALADLFMERVWELTHRFPFYSERKAETIARTEIDLAERVALWQGEEP